MTGQQIDPSELRPGDRVRVTDTWAFTIKDHGLADRDSAYESFHDSGVDKEWSRTWELIERPKPEAKLGSVWVDPEAPKGTINRFLYVGDFAYVPVQPAYGEYVRTFAMGGGDQAAQLIARLVPAEEQA